MSAQNGLNDKISKIRQSKYGGYLGLLLATVVTVMLTMVTYIYVSSILCLLPMLVAFLAYGIPTYLGFKDRKKLAIFGLGLFLLIGVALGSALYVNIDGYEAAPLSSDDNALIDGIATPAQGVPGDTYNFTVTLTSTGNNASVGLELLNNWDSTTRNLTMTSMGVSNTTGTETFYIQLSDMDEGIYYFSYHLSNDTAYVETDQEFGPVNAGMDVVFNNCLMSGILVSYLEIAILFYVLLLLTWWMDRSKKKMFAMEQTRKKPVEKRAMDEKFVCSDCGGDVPSDADKCPKCGAKFDDDEELKCPQCSAKLLKTDEKCWNCGKKL